MVSFAQQFDAAGRRTRLAAAVGSTADFLTDYVYDRLGRIDTIEQQGQGGAAVATKYVDFAFDAAGQPDELKRYADSGGTQLVAETDWSFDGAGRLTDLTHAKGAATLADYDWQFDAAGRMTRFVSSNDGTVDYTNDATGQFTGADYDYQSDENYVYDENGNRVNNGYTTGPNNRMTSDGTYTYLYDAEGNRTHNFVDNDTDGQIGAGDTDVTQYAWDHRNRLVKRIFDS